MNTHQIRTDYARDMRDVRAALRAAHLSGNYTAASVLRVNLNLLLKAIRHVTRRSA